MRNALNWFVSLGLTALLVACAQGTTGDDDDDSPDASTNGPDAFQFPDAAPTPDARIFPDAAPIPDAPLSTIDAPLGGTCNSNSECTASDDCCFMPFGPPGFCVLGVEDPIFGCLPN